MNYLQFRNMWHTEGCFNIYQVYAVCPHFNRANFYQWTQKGYLVRLRQDWYAFSDMLKVADFNRVVANKIYTPSYISLHAALAYYGIIPESVFDVTSVTSNRTTYYKNAFGEYSYQSIKPTLFFGYNIKRLAIGHSFLLAQPEKAILDLLYLYPEYNTIEALRHLRLDDDWMNEELNVEKLLEMSERTKIKSLERRIKLLLEAYLL